MKNIILFIGFTCLLTKLPAQNGGWYREFRTGEMHSVQVLPNGYSFLCTDNGSLFFQKTDLQGNPFAEIFLGSEPADATVLADGGFALINKNGYSSPVFTIQKLDSLGQLVWEKSIPDSLGWRSVSISATPNGGLFVAAVQVEYSALPLYLNTKHQRLQLFALTNTGDIGFQKTVYIASNYSDSPSIGISVIASKSDSACLLGATFRSGYYNQYSLLLSCDILGSVQSNGYAGSIPFGNSFNSSISDIAQLKNGNLFLTSHRGGSSGGLHPACWYHGQLVEASADSLKQLINIEYPTSTFQVLKDWQPYPYLTEILDNGDLLVVVSQDDDFRLWRGSPDLTDTLWEKQLPNPSQLFSFGTLSTPRRDRFLQATPDGGAILGGWRDDNVFLRKIDFWGEGLPQVGPVVLQAGDTQTDKIDLISAYIFPNPTADAKTEIIVDCPNECTKTVRIFNMNGHLVLEKTFFENQVLLELPEASKGVFFAEIWVSEKLITRKKLLSF